MDRDGHPAAATDGGNTPVSMTPREDRSRTAAARPVALAADVFAALQARAVPFDDDVNSVLRRVLRLAPDHGGSGMPLTGARCARAAPGSILPLDDYGLPILRVLADRGGWAATSEVISGLEKHLDPMLSPPDRQPLARGRIRWHTRVDHARLALIRRGHMRAGSPRGIWEITPSGRAHLADHD